MSKNKELNELTDAFISMAAIAATKAQIDLKRNLVDLIQTQLTAGIAPVIILSNIITELGNNK
jgi:hypothetical protein